MPKRGTGYATGLDVRLSADKKEYIRRLNARPRAKNAKLKFAATHRTYNMWRNAKIRAHARRLAFDITEEDIVVPEVCPVLGLPLAYSTGRHADNSPTLDRIIPRLGYVRGNVRVISYRANRLKCDGTYEEFVMILADFQKRQYEETWA